MVSLDFKLSWQVVAFPGLTLLVTVAFFAAALFFSGWRGFIP